MEGVLIFFTVLFCIATVVTVLDAIPWVPFHVVLPKRKPRAEVDPWAGWREIKANLDASRKREHEGWQTDFNRLVQATCAHSYPSTGHAPTYYTCYKCKYVEPWDEPHEGCTCTYETITTTASPFPEYKLTWGRYGNCKWHGVDWENFNRRSDRSNKPFKSVKELQK